MNAGGAFGGNRGLKPIPPEKGVFPLDHFHECDSEKKAYMECLKSNNYKSEKCRPLSKKYLECRMERNLMAKQNISELGFKEADDKVKAGVTHVDNEVYHEGNSEPVAGFKN